ncbi:alpha/beta hydrolase [Synechococcus elongatus]|uniref:alpha/beta hydrolase n=1 Tax=Synechococcus elongatus TaxID=32046 RepID=UPI000F7DF30E|nr:alpha/beta hydrolase [Synechococcus elongatus]
MDQARTTTVDHPDRETPFLLFAQHGWDDRSYPIQQMAQSIVPQHSQVYAPNLGRFRTWIAIEPLIQSVEAVVLEAIAQYPDRPLRFLGHSMGGLIWLEVLSRHREWWDRTHSLVLVGSPVSGSDVCRLLDPFGRLPSIAKDLGRNRRPLAEAIAAQIPTASIVSDLGDYSDGLVPVNSSEFERATLITLKDISHARLKSHPQVAEAIAQFWKQPSIAPRPRDRAGTLIAQLRSLNLTECNHRNFAKAAVLKSQPDGVKIWRWLNPLRVQHIFVSSPDPATGRDCCRYAAYTGWLEDAALSKFLEKL